MKTFQLRPSELKARAARLEQADRMRVKACALLEDLRIQLEEEPE